MLNIVSPDFNITQQPEGLMDLEHRIYLSDELNGYLEEFSGELVFRGSEYKYLRDRFLTDTCGIVPVTITDDGINLSGNLFLNDAEWRVDLREVRIGVVDAGFLSLIDQNMGIKAYVNIGRSKNDVDISSYVSVQSDIVLKRHDTSGGQTDAINRSGVYVYDAFKMLVAFMTDGAIQFTSDYFNPETDPSDPTTPRNPTLITAEETRTGNGDFFPYISFEDLYKDMHRLYNLSFATEVVDGVYYLRIEPSSYFRNANNSLVISQPDSIVQRSNRGSFYQKVQFQSREQDEEDFDYFPNQTFKGFRGEEFHLGGQCNTSAVLDLRMSELITDPNVIMAALPTHAGGQASFSSKNEDIFIVILDGNNESIQSVNPLDSDLIFYNGRLSNFEISNRWGDGVPFPIFLFLGENQNGAKIDLLTSYTPTWTSVVNDVMGVLLEFDTVDYDPNSNLSTISGGTLSLNQGSGAIYPDDCTVFTAPLDAIYTVTFDLFFYFPEDVYVDIYIGVFDGINPNQIDQYYIPQGLNPVGGGIYTQSGSQTLFLNSGEQVAIGLYVFRNPASQSQPNTNTPIIIYNSFMQVNDPFTIEKTYDPRENYLIDTSIEYPLTGDDWNEFLDSRYGKVTVATQDGNISGFTKDVKRNLQDGRAEITLSSKFFRA